MKQKPVSEYIENLGYYLLPKANPARIGYTGLLVAMRAEPTRQHFDPQRIRIRLRDENGLSTWHTLSLRTPLESSARACMGKVTLTDRIGKRADFFTYGGSLEVAESAHETVYSLRSQAPILWLTEHGDTVVDDLVAETEARLAVIEARWVDDERGFSRLLAEADPLRVYSGAICSIIQDYEEHRSLQSTFGRLFREMKQEEEWLRSSRLWPQSPCTLDELLSPAAT